MAITLQVDEKTITLAPQPDTITLQTETKQIVLSTVGISGGEINTGLNVGAGVGEVFRDKTGSQFNFRTIDGTNGIVTSTAGDVVNVSGENLVQGVSGPVTTNTVAVFDGTGFQLKVPDVAVDFNAQAITNVGNIDGRDVSTDGATLDAHVASTANPHSTSIANVGAGTLAQLNTAVSDANLLPDTRTLTAGVGLSGGGNLTADRTFDVTGFQETSGPTELTYGSIPDGFLIARSGLSVIGIDPASVGGVPPSRTLTAGIGLSGGGDLSADRTFNVTGFQETSGPTELSYGAVSDGFLLSRSGTSVIGIDPSTVGTTDHGALTGLTDDDHANYAFLPGRASNQTWNATTIASGELILRGSTAVDQGLIRSQSPLVFDATPVTNSAYSVSAAYTDTVTGAFVGGIFNASPTLTFDNGLFIWEGLRVAPNIQSLAPPSFAAFTLMNALATLRAGPNASDNPLNPLVVNHGVALENGFAGNRTAASSFGMNFAPQTRATVSGAVMNVTSQTGINFQPVFSTVAGSTANLGTMRGIHMRNPQVALFQPGAGPAVMTGYYGLDMDNITFGGSIQRAAVRSAQAAGTNFYFLLQTGDAQSQLQGQLRFPVDLTGVTYGASGDYSVGWGAAGFYFQQFTATGNQLRWSNPSSDRYLFDTSSGNTLAELNFNCNRFSMGAQTGAVGNQIGAFVAPTRSTSVSGEWSDFILTQAGNLTPNADLTLVAGWTINAPNMDAGTGTVTTATALRIGGNVDQGTNRYGLSVISNPTGGTLNYCARFEGAAGVRVDGIFEHTGSTLGFYGTAPAAQPAAYTVTNPVARRSFDTTSVTLQELAEVVGTIIGDLQSLGLVA